MANLKLLFKAVEENDLDRIESYVATNADILKKDKFGHTALHYASYLGHLEIAKFLVELMCSSNIINTGMSNTKAIVLEKDNEGWTALHWASEQGRLEIVKLLIEYGMTNANRNILEKDKFGRTALHWASFRGHFEIAKLLVESISSFDKSESDVLKDLSEKDNYGQTALFIASREGHFDVVKLLVETGSDIEAVNKKGKTTINQAKTEEIKYFLTEQL